MQGETLIYFDGQFWVGLFSEKKDGKIVMVGKYVFGGEPTLTLIDEWLARGLPGLKMFPADRLDVENKAKIKNPKRALRLVRKTHETRSEFRETLAQKAMRESLEGLKKESKKIRSVKRREHLLQNYLKKQAKKKQKKRGR